MNCKIGKSIISGEIVCPSNKSYTHRAIFLASLAGSNSKVENVLFSADTNATIEACREFGAEIEVDKSSLIVKNPIKFDNKPRGVASPACRAAGRCDTSARPDLLACIEDR